MRTEIETKAMIAYLQSMMEEYKRRGEKFGLQHEYTEEIFDNMIACKEMAEALIGAPVNLRRDGTVTIGF